MKEYLLKEYVMKEYVMEEYVMEEYMELVIVSWKLQACCRGFMNQCFSVDKSGGG